MAKFVSRANSTRARYGTCGCLLLLALVLGCSEPPPCDCAALVEVDTSSPGALSQDVRDLLNDPDGLRRASRFGRLLPTLDPSHVPAVRKGVESAYLDRGQVELILFAEWWAAFDPEAAHSWTQEFWSAQHPNVEPAAVRVWARDDPQTALEHVLSRSNLNSTPTLHSALIDALVVGWFESGREGLLEWVAGLKNASLQQAGLATLARRRVLRDGPAATIAWADGLPDENPRAKQWLIQRVASAITLREPELAAQYAERLTQVDLYSHYVVRRVARRWAEKDPLATLQWLEGFDIAPLRAEALRATFKVWLRDDEAGALAWLDGQPSAAWLDPARRSTVLTRLSSQTNPAWETLSNEAMKIHTDAVRWSTVSWALRHWRGADEAAAERWLASEPTVPEEIRVEIRELGSPKPNRFKRRQAAKNEPRQDGHPASRP